MHWYHIILSHRKVRFCATLWQSTTPALQFFLHSGSLLISFRLFPRVTRKLQVSDLPTWHPLDQVLKDLLKEFLQHNLPKRVGIGVKPSWTFQSRRSTTYPQCLGSAEHISWYPDFHRLSVSLLLPFPKLLVYLQRQNSTSPCPDWFHRSIVLQPGYKERGCHKHWSYHMEL